MSTSGQLESIARQLTRDADLAARGVGLSLDGCTIRVRSNSAPLLDWVEGYFAHVVGEVGDDAIEVIAIEREQVALDTAFTDWPREPGKTGRKDSYFDFPGGRLVRKVRTGMVFLQSAEYRIAAGPCLRLGNQLVNFINSQYMNWLQQRGWLICHASGLVRSGHALGIAGFSGGGKSTLMLRLLEDRDINYLTNDRLFVKAAAGVVRVAGIPKLPRVNPGTIIGNRRLHSLISVERRDELLAIPRDELWELEEKHDVMISEVYGSGRIETSSPMSAFLVLNWQRQSPEEPTLQPVDLAQRRDLLKAIMKSPGPFYQHLDGSFHEEGTPFDEGAYLQALQGVAVYEALGRIDFERMTQLIKSVLE